MSEPMLALDGLVKTYNRGKPGEVQVLRGRDPDGAPGEVVALVAPSGAGKSTLLHIAGLLDVADAGEVRHAGRAMNGLGDRARTEARRADVGFIYQFHHLLPEFSALENIVLPQLANGVPKARGRGARRRTCWTRVGIAPRARHRPAALSGGEQQRVAFCRALANAPKLLLADEPTGNLDPDTSDQVFDDADAGGARNRPFGADRHPQPGACGADGPHRAPAGGPRRLTLRRGRPRGLIVPNHKGGPDAVRFARHAAGAPCSCRPACRLPAAGNNDRRGNPDRRRRFRELLCALSWPDRHRRRAGRGGPAKSVPRT